MTSKLIALTIAASSIASSHAAVLIDWDFSGLDWRANQGSGLVTNDLAPNPILSSASANAAPGLSSTDLIPSTGVTPNGLRVVVNNNTRQGEADLRDFDFGGNGGNDNFVEFTITGTNPGTLNIDSISVTSWRNGGGAPDGMAFDVNVDGGGYSLYAPVQVDPNTGDFGFDTFTFSSPIAGATTVGIRFTPRAQNGGSTGNLHINGIAVNGTVVPEPSVSLLGAFSALMLLRRRRRS